jgi:hypothetical protein
MRPRTRDYYRDHLRTFLDAVAGRRPALGIPPREVGMYKAGWYSVQTVRRLYNKRFAMGLVEKIPFARIKTAEPCERERIRTPTETARLLRAADRHFRPFLLAMRHTIARPQEIRALRWEHLIYKPAPMFALKDFKAKKRRFEKQRKRWAHSWTIALTTTVPFVDYLAMSIDHGRDAIFSQVNSMLWVGQFDADG